MNWSEFFAMGGYGFYVWSVYALAVVVLVTNLILPLRRDKAVRRQLQDLHRLHEDRHEAAQ
jgi:heme exporter protein D